MNKHRWTGAMAGVILLLVAGCSETGRIADGADGIHLSGPGPGNGTPGAQDATEDDSCRPIARWSIDRPSGVR
jgi:hypothetical protein